MPLDSTIDWDGMSKRQINKHFRENDESNLFPINGKFNATERAIRRMRKFQKDYGSPIEGHEYALSLDSEITKIVNDPKIL